MSLYWIFAAGPGGTREGEVTFEVAPWELSDLEHKLSQMVEKGRLNEYDIREVIGATVIIDGERKLVNDGSIDEWNTGLTPDGVLKWAKGLK